MRSLLALCSLGGVALAALNGHGPQEHDHSHSHGHEPVLEAIGGIQHYEVVDMNSLRSKSTLSAEGRMEHVFSEMKFSAYQQQFHFHLLQNDKLFGPNYHEQRQTYNEKKEYVGRDVHKPLHNCHYHGHFANQSRHGETLVMMSACNSHGFQGMAKAADGEWYGFEAAHPHLSKPTLDTHRRRLLSTTTKHTLARQTANEMDLHIVYKVASVGGDIIGSCGVKSDAHDHSTHQHAHTLSVRDQFNSIMSADGRHKSEQGRVLAQSDAVPAKDAARHLLQETTGKTVELLIINDKARYDEWQIYCGTANAPDPCRVEDDSAAVVNAVAAIYLNSNFDPVINIVLSSQITMRDSDAWETVQPPAAKDGKPSEVSVDSYLEIFHTWRSKADQRVEGNPVQLVEPHDNCHLFSGMDFEGQVLGYAGVGTMCNYAISGGINQVAAPANAAKLTTYAATVAHEMGHNFGMRHDSSGNTCAQTGSTMNAMLTSNPPKTFSECSKSYYLTSIQYRGCLDNIPKKRWGDPVCGNGFIEVGEECDCGASDCTNLDKCCNGATCMLVSGAQCSSVDTCCTAECQFQPANVVCRPAADECDISDQCTGDMSTCPIDRVAGAGFECTTTAFGDGLCYGGVCMSYNRQCKQDLQQVQFAPYGKCSDESYFPEDNFCSVLWCEPLNDPGSCWSFPSGISIGGGESDLMRLTDGTPCGNGFQCKYINKQASCVSQALLNPNFGYVAEKWESCISCSVAQKRIVLCEEITALSSYVVDDKACSQGSKPNGLRMCVNETLGCSGSNDTKAEALARSISEKLNLLDTAADLRAMIPRVYGPTEFNIDDIEYIKGILLLGAVPAGIAFVCLLYMLAFCCCDCGCGNTDAHPHPHEGAKKLVLWVILFLLSLLCCIFACMALFFNGEVNRAAIDPDTGIVPLMGEMLISAITNTRKFKAPLDYIIDSKNETLDPALLVLKSTSMPLVKAGINDLTAALASFAVLVANRTTTAVPANGTAAAITLTCGAFCSGAAGSTAAIVANLETELLPPYKIMEDAITVTNSYMEDLGSSLSSPASKYGSFPQVKYAVDETLLTFEDMQVSVDKYRVLVDQANQIRYPFTVVLCCFPLFMFVSVVVAGLCRKVTMYKAVADVGWIMLVVFWVLLAVHLPMAAAMGDSCEFLNKVETGTSNVTFFSPQESAVLVACISGRSIVDSLNLTSQINLMNASIQGIVDPSNRPVIDDMYDSATEKPLTDYGTTVSALSSSNFGLSLRAKSDKLLELNAAAGTSLTLANYASYSTTDPAVVKLIDELNQLFSAEVRIAASIKELQDKWANVTQTLKDLKANTKKIQEGMITASTKMGDLLVAAGTLKANGDCGNIGETYVTFKNSYCGTLTSAISYLALAFFMLGFLIPFEIFNAIREGTYIHPDETDGKGAKSAVIRVRTRPQHQMTKNGGDLDGW